jgi:hypothetical protein
MTERELSELEEAAATGSLTAAEQRRLLREIRKLQEERAALTCDLYMERKQKPEQERHW